MESDDESSFRRWWMNKQKTIFMQFKNMNQTNEKSYKYISGATNLQESVQAQESYVVPHHLHPPTGDLHHHDLLRGPIPIPLLQYLGRWPEKLLLNINLMILLPQIHYRLISNISLFVPHRQPYLLCRCHCPVQEPRGGPPAHHARSGSPSSSGGPPSKRPRTHEGTRTIQVQFLNDWSHFCKEND